MSLVHTDVRRGDTLIEVIFALAIFSLISVFTIILMNSGVATAQSSLEMSVARNEIDAQAEALRFIHNSYLSERELSSGASGGNNERIYRDLWNKLTSSIGFGGDGYANDPSSLGAFSIDQCSSAYQTTGNDSLFDKYAFVLNTRNIDPNNIDGTIVTSRPNGGYASNIFTESPLYPRLVFTNASGSDNSEDVLELGSYNRVARAEGIWVISAYDKSSSRFETSNVTGTAEYFDFHIRTCWYTPNHVHPTTIATIIRLYNPEMIEQEY